MARERVMVLLPTWAGDFVMATPLLGRLRQALPDAEIVGAGPRLVVDALRSSAAVDGTLDLSPEGRSGLARFVERWRRMRSGRFDRALLLPGSLGSALAAWAARIRVRQGYAREARGLLLTSAIPHPPDFRTRHRVRYFLDLLPLVGVDSGGLTASPATDPLALDVDAPARAWADAFLADLPPGPGPLVAVHPGGTYGSSKRWPAESFARALGLAAERAGGMRVLAVGGPDDEAAAGILAEHLEPRGIPVVAAAGKTPGLLELAALFDRVDLVVSTDSGPMHVAAARGRPQVAVFTSTSPAFTAPWSDRATVVAAEIRCSPCFGRNCPSTAGAAPPCHGAVTAEAVAGAMVARLGL